jgi:hypothetical protein
LVPGTPGTLLRALEGCEYWPEEPQAPITFRSGPKERSIGRERKAVEGFAHRFRPTYAGANMGHPYRAVATASGLRARPAASHISRKTSEMWGTRLLVRG